MPYCFRRDDKACIANSIFKTPSKFTHTSAISPRPSREFCCKLRPSPIRGRRECRAPDSARSLVCEMKKHTSLSHHGHTGFTRHSPRNGFNGFLRALSGDRAFLSPSPAICARHIHRLDASVEASRPHDFAVRFMRHSSKAPKRPPHPALHVRDDCDTPLIARRDGGNQ